MSNLLCNSAKGRWAAWCADSPGSLLVIPLKASGLGTDDAIRDSATLTDLLTHATEHDMGRLAPEVTSVNAAVDNTNNRVDVDFDDLTWTAPSGDDVGALVLMWDDGAGNSNDSLRLICKWDFAVTLNGADVTAQLPAGGVLRAS